MEILEMCAFSPYGDFGRRRTEKKSQEQVNRSESCCYLLFMFIRRESRNIQIEIRNINNTKTEQTDILLLILLLTDRPTE